MSAYVGVVHVHGNTYSHNTGHIQREGGRSLCGFERPHMNIECMDDWPFEAWLKENRQFANLCRRCLRIYDLTQPELKQTE